VKEWQGSLLITTGAIAWTTDCNKALVAISNGNKSALKALKKKQIGYLNRLTDLVRDSKLGKLDRNKTVALITMEIHNRDVMERMIKANCSNPQDFEWLSQLRFIFNKDEGQYRTCIVKQTNCTLSYSYEYQGNNGRLVVTPLTDRCVLTLLTAMFLHRGGNPLGPAGTGKTETVKVSERSERALRKTRIRATTELTLFHSIRLNRSVCSCFINARCRISAKTFPSTLSSSTAPTAWTTSPLGESSAACANLEVGVASTSSTESRLR